MTSQHTLRRARYERACWWLERGVDIVPLKLQSKELQSGYGARKAHITTTDFARKWFLNTDANLGVVLGEAASLAVADWDDAQAYEAWRATTGAAIETLIEQTARGYHLFVTGDSLTSSVGNGCEFKTRGICMVSPSVHPSGVIYRIVKDAPIITLDAERARVLFPFLSEPLHNMTQVFAGHVPRQSPCDQLEKKSVIARIKAARPIMDEISAAGVKLRPGGTATLIGLCPFHDDHSPSLWVNPESGLWGCNRPGCLAAGTHDVINFRALQRGISNSMAIKQLAAEYLVSKPIAMQ